MSIEDIVGNSGRSSRRCFAEVRFVAIGLAIDLTLMSLPTIGRWLGGRDHSSIINGRKRFLAMMEDESFRNRFDELKAEIGRDHAEKPKVRRYENSPKWQRAIAAGRVEA
jgi:chromosomal replication initiation ATPase DnaA